MFFKPQMVLILASALVFGGLVMLFFNSSPYSGCYRPLAPMTENRDVRKEDGTLGKMDVYVFPDQFALVLRKSIGEYQIVKPGYAVEEKPEWLCPTADDARIELEVRNNELFSAGPSGSTIPSGSARAEPGTNLHIFGSTNSCSNGI